MANKKSVGHAYNIDFLNVVFAASSLFLFFTTIWMVFDDFDREWKGYQRQFVLLEGYVTSLNLQAAQAGIDPVRLQQLSAERAAAEEQLAANAEQVARLEDALADVEADYYLANQEFNFQKADYDVRAVLLRGASGRASGGGRGGTSGDRRHVRPLGRARSAGRGTGGPS